MAKYILFIKLLFLSTFIFAQKKEYFLKTSFGISNSFFRYSSDVPQGLSLRQPYASKGPIGYYYNTELQIVKDNGLIYEYGYSRYEYSKYAHLSYGSDINTTWVTGRMYHKLNIFHFAINKPYKLKHNDFISLGVGVNIPFESNQFFETRNGSTSFSFLESTDMPLGSQIQVRYEKIVNKIRCGVEAKLITLIIPFGINDLSVGPYVRLKF